MPFRKISEGDLAQLDPSLAADLNALGEAKRIGEAELHAQDLVRRAQPLLRKMIGASAPPKRKREVREHIPLALVMLHGEWKARPELDGRTVDFSEFVAARLLFRVRELDRQAFPDLYDPHGRYVPPPAVDDEPDYGAMEPEVIRVPNESGAQAFQAALPDDPLERLARLGELYGYPPASMTNIVRVLGEVRDGRITNGRKMAKELGTSDYKTHPATGALLAAWDFLEEADQQTRTNLRMNVDLDPGSL